MNDFSRTAHPKRIEASIEMLNAYLGRGGTGAEIAPLIRVLEAMAADPGNEALLVKLSEVFGSLGITQGAVLTYAPYLSIILPHDLLEGMD